MKVVELTKEDVDSLGEAMSQIKSLQSLIKALQAKAGNTPATYEGNRYTVSLSYGNPSFVTDSNKVKLAFASLGMEVPKKPSSAPKQWRAKKIEGEQASPSIVNLKIEIEEIEKSIQKLARLQAEWNNKVNK